MHNIYLLLKEYSIEVINDCSGRGRGGEVFFFVLAVCLPQHLNTFASTLKACVPRKKLCMSLNKNTQYPQAKAEELKNKGNVYFGKAKYQEALDLYENALTLTALITRKRPDIVFC